MSKKLKRIIAIIALVFMAVFTVSLVAYLVDKTLLNGAIGFLTLFSGGIGIALFLVIWMSRDNYDSASDDEPYDGKSKTPDEPEASDRAASPEANENSAEQNVDNAEPQSSPETESDPR